VLSGDMTWSIVDDRETTRFTGKLEGGALKDLEALTGSTIPMTDRAARRFCDRLVELGVARELTGRATFRLYGIVR